MSDNWVIIDDNKIRQCWQCPDCGYYIDNVDPTNFAESGTPVCPECDCDMTYNYTEIRLG